MSHPPFLDTYGHPVKDGDLVAIIKDGRIIAGHVDGPPKQHSLWVKTNQGRMQIGWAYNIMVLNGVKSRIMIEKLTLS